MNMNAVDGHILEERKRAYAKSIELNYLLKLTMNCRIIFKFFSVYLCMWHVIIHPSQSENIPTERDRQLDDVFLKKQSLSNIV